MTLLALLLRLLGLSGLVGGWLAERKVKRQAQAVADAPSTRRELEETLRDGKL